MFFIVIKYDINLKTIYHEYHLSWPTYSIVAKCIRRMYFEIFIEHYAYIQLCFLLVVVRLFLPLYKFLSATSVNFLKSNYSTEQSKAPEIKSKGSDAICSGKGKFILRVKDIQKKVPAALKLKVS